MVELVPPVENYVSFGTDVIAQNQEYKDMLFDYFFTVFNTKRLGQTDKISACRLLESVLLHLPGQVDNYISPALDIVRVRLEDEEEYKKPGYKVYLLEVIINAIYYNPLAALQYLEHNQFLTKFLHMWFDEAEKFLRVHDKTLSILALMKIVQLPSEHIPPSLQSQSALQYLMKGMLTFFKSLPDAENRRSEAHEYEEDGGDSVAAEGEGEWNEEDTWSDAEDGADVADEAQEYLDFLAQQVILVNLRN
jgi:importin-7